MPVFVADRLHGAADAAGSPLHQLSVPRSFFFSRIVEVFFLLCLGLELLWLARRAGIGFSSPVVHVLQERVTFFSTYLLSPVP